MRELEEEFAEEVNTPKLNSKDMCPNGVEGELSNNGKNKCGSPHKAHKKLHSLLEQLKEKVASDGGFPQGAIVNGDIDRSLLRFLSAADFDVAKAHLKICKMREWRKENNIDGILKWMLPEEKLSVLRQYMPSSYHGYDKHGHPIHLEQTGHFNWEVLRHCSAKDLVNMHILFMEYQSKVLFSRASSMQGRTVDQMTNILDLRGLNIGVLSNMSALNIFKEVQKIDQDYYPEMLNVTYIVNTNWVFRAVWKVLKVVFPAKEHKKMRMIPKGEKGEAMLREIIGEDLPRFLGGSCSCKQGCISGPLGTGSQPSDYQSKMLQDLGQIRAALNNCSERTVEEKHIQRTIRIWSLNPEKKLEFEYTESETSVTEKTICQ